MPAKPKTIRDVGDMIAAGHEIWFGTKEFIDAVIWTVRAAGGPSGGLYPIPAAMFSEAPVVLEDALARAHLAALAEYLAEISGQTPPEWSQSSMSFLERPIYFGGERARQLIIDDTPGPYARRNLFPGRMLSKLFIQVPPDGEPRL
jgi:hypothetical protein